MRPKKSQLDQFVAIDGNSLVHRAFHAFPASLVTSSGLQVNAVYGFTSILLRVLSDLNPKYLVCTFDVRAPTFRHTAYADYKAKRPPVDGTLIDQFPLVKEVLAAFNVPILEKKGFEADDVLGTLASYVTDGKWKNSGLELIIVTGDSDLLQAVDDTVRVWLPRGSFKDMVLYDAEEVKKRYGFGPENIPDYKALVGDQSDNIPGVPGIGEKTALELIKTYGHLENIYSNLSKIDERRAKLLVDGEENAGMSHMLVLLKRDVDLDVQLEDCLMHDFRRSDAISVFQKFEFRSLLQKIPMSVHDHAGEQIDLFGESGTQEQRDTLGKSVRSRSVPVANFSKMPSEWARSDAAYIVYLDPGACVVGVREKKTMKYFRSGTLTRPDDMTALLESIMSTDIPIVTCGWEQLCQTIAGSEVTHEQKKLLHTKITGRVEDIGQIAYYLSSGQKDYSLRKLAFTYVGVELPEDLSDEKYCSPMIEVVSQIHEGLSEGLSAHKTAIGGSVKRNGKPIDNTTWQDIDVTLSMAIADMARTGVAVDSVLLKKKEQELAGEIQAAEKRIFESIGHEFNIDSNRQLADMLFTELGLPVQKKLKTGPSTDESVLLKLHSLHPCIKDILTYREMVKMDRTYIKPLQEYASSSSDGRIHSTFGQMGTTTGRLTSSSPNVQNIPVQSELGTAVRDAFVSSEGKTLLSADYSQIDLRVAAHFSQDQHMAEDFSRGVDFHTATAARIFGKKEKHVQKKERRIAKTINFGVLYGLSAFGLSETLGIGRDDAAKYIDTYFETYDGVRIYLEKSLEEAKANGYAETALGRRRYIGGLRSGNHIARAAAEREAVNLPIQGTASDIMRCAMCDLYGYLLDRKGEVDLVLQIHDEFVFEVEPKRAPTVAQDIVALLTHALEFSVPIECHIQSGQTLASMKPL